MKPTPELAQEMRAHGMRPRLAWVHDPQPAEAQQDTKAAGKRRADRERQRRQADRDATKWARCYAKAPDDDDARALVAKVARAIVDQDTRRAVRIAVEHPEVVFLGSKLVNLRGFRRWAVMRLTGGS